jgi:hypothetical protein
LYVIALNSTQLFPFPQLQHWNEDQIYMGILSEVDQAQCVLTSLPSVRNGLVPIGVHEKFLLSSPSFLVATPCLECIAYRWFYLRGTIQLNVKLTEHLLLVPSKRMRGGIPLLHSNQLRNLLYRSPEIICSAPVPGCNSRRFCVSSDSD